MASRADIYAGPFSGALVWTAAFQPRKYTDGGTLKILRKVVAHSHAGGRLDSVDRIGEHLKANLENLETWAEIGINPDFPANRKVVELRRRCCRAVISDIFNWIYRRLEAAAAIEDLAAASRPPFYRMAASKYQRGPIKGVSNAIHQTGPHRPRCLTP